MQPTSKERREVAAKLRGEEIARNSEEAYAVLLSCIGIRPQLPAVRTYKDAMARMADLIDPTCHVVSTTSQDWSDGSTVYSHELSCGHTCRTDWTEPPAFCDECGARVVSE